MKMIFESLKINFFQKILEVPILPHPYFGNKLKSLNFLGKTTMAIIYLSRSLIIFTVMKKMLVNVLYRNTHGI